MSEIALASPKPDKLYYFEKEIITKSCWFEMKGGTSSREFFLFICFGNRMYVLTVLDSVLDCFLDKLEFIL